MADHKRILVVDDDPQIRKLVVLSLEREGYRVDTAGSGDAMRNSLDSIVPDLVILDLGLPDVDGLTLAKEIRTGSDIPIIILTGKSDLVDRIVGLEVGADDYVTKPFNLRELVARVRSVLRRTYKYSTQNSSGRGRNTTAKFSGWKLDLTAYELTTPDGERIHLTNHEFGLLAIFVKNSNHVMSRDQLMNHIAGKDWVPDDRSIDVLVGKLRKKIERDPNQPGFIKSIRGVGYKFTSKVEFG